MRKGSQNGCVLCLIGMHGVVGAVALRTGRGRDVA